jgi:alanine racemase
VERSSAITTSGADETLAGSRLTVDLGALVENFRLLSRLSAPARSSGVVKADAYGLGIPHVVPALVRAGCRTFFVALPEEGIAVRKAAPDADIFVLNGLFGVEAAVALHAADLIPVLNCAQDIALWRGSSRGARLRCALNVDTGMNRLGLALEEALALASDATRLEGLKPVLVMSHLACADAPGHLKNLAQLESFQRVGAAFQGVESSLANSAGTFLDQSFHCDLTRPGIALYGGAAVASGTNPMRTVVTAEARIVQVRHARAGETVSYGATATLARDTAIAIVAAGYADGYHRSISGSGVPLREANGTGGQGFVAGRRVPILGRVTMDLTMFDVTDTAPGAVKPGDWIELFGPNIPIDEAARAAGTISYEVLTSLGKRYHRRYLESEASA